jgi:hypothetical protein
MGAVELRNRLRLAHRPAGGVNRYRVDAIPRQDATHRGGHGTIFGQRSRFIAGTGSWNAHPSINMFSTRIALS